MLVVVLKRGDERVRRLGWILLGYVACLVACALVATLFLEQGAYNAPIADHVTTFRMALTFSLNFSVTTSLLCVLIAEVAGIRSIFYYLAFSVAPTALVWGTLGVGPLAADALTGRAGIMFVVSGLAGAVVYWWIAGRYAGQRAAGQSGAV